MKVTPKMNFVEGDFDTKDAVMVCVPKWKYRTVELCIKAGNWNIPMAEIKLYDSELFKDADVTFDDAKAFGEEIARRWNECNDKK
jgi:hypothetical protein